MFAGILGSERKVGTPGKEYEISLSHCCRLKLRTLAQANMAASCSAGDQPCDSLVFDKTVEEGLEKKQARTEAGQVHDRQTRRSEDDLRCKLHIECLTGADPRSAVEIPSRVAH